MKNSGKKSEYLLKLNFFFIGEDFNPEIDRNNVQDTKEQSQTREKKME